MIREATPFEPVPTWESPRAFPPGMSRLLPLEPISHESIENEISRLTWAVLDGRATSEERLRLAALVSSQHERRHR